MSELVYQKAIKLIDSLSVEPDLKFQNTTHPLYEIMVSFGDYLNPYTLNLMRGYKMGSYNNF